MDLAQLVSMLRRRWLVIVVCTLLGTALGVVVPMTMTPVYDARAQLFVSISGSDAEASLQSSQLTLSRIKSYVPLVASPDVLRPVIEELDLDLTVPQLREKVTVSSPPNSLVLNVTAQSGDAELAAGIANLVADELGAFIVELETAPGAQQHVTTTMFRPAEVPADPASPRTKMSLALGLLGGLMAGLALAALRQTFDRTFRTAAELKDASGTGVLAVIHTDARLGGTAFVLEDASSAPEGFRTLRASLRFVDVDNPPRTITVTSSVPYEGKTTIAIHLALAMAQSGQRVCLVEGDLRRPRVSEQLGIINAVGLSDALSGEYDLDEVLVPWQDGLLTVVPSGTVPPDPAALLSSHAMGRLLAQLREDFDVVILDSAPLLPVVDGAVLGGLSDGTILVVRHGRTDSIAVARSLETLSAAGAHLLGTVFSQVPLSRQARRGEYSYTPQDGLNARRRTAPHRHAAAPEAAAGSTVATTTADEPEEPSATAVVPSARTGPAGPPADRPATAEAGTDEEPTADTQDPAHESTTTGATEPAPADDHADGADDADEADETDVAVAPAGARPADRRG